jgi:hypothetical protein
MRRSVSSGPPFVGKEIYEEYPAKWTKFKVNKKLLLWAAISFNGLEQLYFIEDKENTDVYQEILDACLPDIAKTQPEEFTFEQDNAANNAAFYSIPQNNLPSIYLYYGDGFLI